MRYTFALIPAFVSTIVFWWWTGTIIRSYDHRMFVIATTVTIIAILVSCQKRFPSSLSRHIFYGIVLGYVVGLIYNTTFSFAYSGGGWLSALSRAFTSWQYMLVVLGFPILLGVLVHGALLALSGWLFFHKRRKST